MLQVGASKSDDPFARHSLASSPPTSAIKSVSNVLKDDIWITISA